MAINRQHLQTIPTDQIKQKIARLDQLFYINEDYNMKMKLRKTMEELKEEVEKRENIGVPKTDRRRLR